MFKEIVIEIYSFLSTFFIPSGDIFLIFFNQNLHSLIFPLKINTLLIYFKQAKAIFIILY